MDLHRAHGIIIKLGESNVIIRGKFELGSLSLELSGITIVYYCRLII